MHLNVTVFLSMLVLGCKTNGISGVYVCDKSTKNADTTILQEGHAERIMDQTCIFTQFEFVGSNTVKIGTESGEVVSSYVVDKDYVRIKGSGSDILLKVQDGNTLNGEGVVQGIYYKR